ncbi:MAG: DUF1266 domain-containing protein [Tannerellaceae bacterium]|nr:DUF1266 domain-containing protein [Tannerellaceae bacterium]
MANEEDPWQEAHARMMQQMQDMMQQVNGGEIPSEAEIEQLMAQALGIDPDEWKSENDTFEIYTCGNKQNLTSSQLRLLAIGAPLMVFNSEYVDSPFSGEEPGELTDRLEQYWDITDRDSAIETIEWLLTEGHRKMADMLTEIIHTYSPADALQLIHSKDPEQKEAWNEKYKEVQQILHHIQKEETSTFTDQLPPTIAGWDYARAAHLACRIWEAGYIDEDEMWKYLQRTAYLTASTFTSWQEFGQSYAVGRGFWRGMESDYDVAAEVAGVLLTHPESPWHQYPIQA